MAGNSAGVTTFSRYLNSQFLTERDNSNQVFRKGITFPVPIQNTLLSPHASSIDEMQF
jgi:hypothetical protein